MKHALCEPLSLLYSTLSSCLFQKFHKNGKQQSLYQCLRKALLVISPTIGLSLLRVWLAKLWSESLLMKFFAYFEQRNIISSTQRGFLKGLSTCTNLLECLNDWTSSLQNKRNVTITYVDFMKAFDSLTKSCCIGCKLMVLMDIS